MKYLVLGLAASAALAQPALAQDYNDGADAGPAGKDGVRIGTVTSGGASPTVERNIARAIVDAAASALGTSVDIEVRGKTFPMEVVAHPFYKRPR